MTTNPIAAFASRHQKVAAGLIILSEFCNVAIGLTIGSSLLPDQPGWYLSVLLIGLIFIRVQFRRYIDFRLSELVSRERFWFQKNSYSLLFLINFLAYIVAGGISGRAVIHPEPALSVSSENYNSYSETSKKDSLTKVSPSHPGSQTAISTPKEKTETKIGYVVLFLFSVLLFFLSSSLACNLACSNQGFLAVLVILLGLGVLAGGFYFLGRVFDKRMKLFKEMTKAERRREGRRYGRTVLGTVLAVALFAIIPSLFH
jgi:hypothetical protein